MTNSIDLDEFLRTDPRDVGCDAAMKALHVYADLYATDPASARGRYPGIDIHLSDCGPCSTDFEGLLALITQ